ncbi:sensor histidine kinase [Ilumatobacter sp.]|uniref:sensor histidine kinase n=1 Tax=Ilumatobacter sp. TaxID=1967498 RepID=UPI003B52DA36
MASLLELSRTHSSLDVEDIDHLQRLTAEWAFLADLCFADLLLHVRSDDGRWMIVDQVRPATNQTMYAIDFVGTWATQAEDLMTRAADEGRSVEGDITLRVDVSGADDRTARVLAVPVRHGDRVIAVLTKEWVVRAGRNLGELERNYSRIFDQFAHMISSGTFPFPGQVADSSAAPRVGDGVMMLDVDATVTYVSPNANSALHRVGIQANPVGMRLAELGFHDGPARQAFERGEPVVEEFEQGADVTLLARCVPLVRSRDGDAHVVGGLLLIRDVTDLRKRDRLLLSKDATIREIHHRVKNNLQTISSLLRLQARRLESAEAKAAVSESVRRIRTIALVHESLSREPGDDIAFIEIVRPLLRLAEEGLQSPDRPVRFSVRGSGGRVPAHAATPLSVVLTELLQNAVDHGFPEGSGGGDIAVVLAHDGSSLTLRVIDDGRGIEPGFDLDQAPGLGLSIVRTLVTTELDGSIEMSPATSSDLAAVGLGDDSARPRGTRVELRVPSAAI